MAEPEVDEKATQRAVEAGLDTVIYKTRDPYLYAKAELAVREKWVEDIGWPFSSDKGMSWCFKCKGVGGVFRYLTENRLPAHSWCLLELIDEEYERLRNV